MNHIHSNMHDSSTVIKKNLSWPDLGSFVSGNHDLHLANLLQECINKRQLQNLDQPQVHLGQSEGHPSTQLTMLVLPNQCRQTDVITPRPSFSCSRRRRTWRRDL